MPDYFVRVYQMAKCWFYMQAQAFISHYEFIYNGCTEFPIPTEEKAAVEKWNGSRG